MLGLPTHLTKAQQPLSQGASRPCADGSARQTQLTQAHIGAPKEQIGIWERQDLDLQAGSPLLWV